MATQPAGDSVMTITIPIEISISVGAPRYAGRPPSFAVEAESVEGAMAPSDEDPAAPAPGELSETADLETARQLANVAPGQFGLQDRRELEARLFEQGLSVA